MLVKVKVHPDGGEYRVEKKTEDSFEVWVREMAVRGEATRAAVRTLAEFLKIPVSHIQVVRGFKSSSKVFDILPFRA